MPLTVQQLNADTTFVLALSDSVTSTIDDDFTILIDPWLTGPSPIFHSYFASTSHTIESAIQVLTELEKPPNLVIVSQPKNDHCNKETLCTLPQYWKGAIVAVPAAAKKIRSWKRFREDQIQVVPAYSAKNPDTVIKIPIATTSAANTQGEITIANIPEPYDFSAVHNAIAITYHPPISPSTNPPKPLSILYTPHGLNPSLLTPYLTHQQRPPIDLLFHSLNTEANPKLMGGVVSNGAPGGVKIAKMLGARVWVGAHDEVKRNTGIATKLIRCRVYSVEEVEKMLGKEGTRGPTVRSLGVGGTLRVGEEDIEDGMRNGETQRPCNTDTTKSPSDEQG